MSPDRTAQNPRTVGMNSVMVVSSDSVEKSGPEVDMATSASLAEIHDILHGYVLQPTTTPYQSSRFYPSTVIHTLENNAKRSESSTEEIYARTPDGKVIVARRKEEKEEELYMVVGRKDASLTDAECELVCIVL